MNVTRITTDIPTYLDDFVNKYKEHTGIPKSRIISDAIKEFLKNKNVIE